MDVVAVVLLYSTLATATSLKINTDFKSYNKVVGGSESCFLVRGLRKKGTSSSSSSSKPQLRFLDTRCFIQLPRGAQPKDIGV